MPHHMQLVMGPTGSGKSTYCDTMVQHCEALNQSIQVVNLDPTSKHFNYSVMASILELIEVDDGMKDNFLRFGPYGGLVFCMEYFANSFYWLEKCPGLDHGEDAYILLDCPGQIEMYNPCLWWNSWFNSWNSGSFKSADFFLLILSSWWSHSSLFLTSWQP